MRLKNQYTRINNTRWQNFKRLFAVDKHFIDQSSQGVVKFRYRIGDKQRKRRGLVQTQNKNKHWPDWLIAPNGVWGLRCVDPLDATIKLDKHQRNGQSVQPTRMPPSRMRLRFVICIFVFYVMGVIGKLTQLLCIRAKYDNCVACARCGFKYTLTHTHTQVRWWFSKTTWREHSIVR